MKSDVPPADPSRPLGSNPNGVMPMRTDPSVQPEHSRLSHFLSKVTGSCVKRPWATIGIAAVSVVISALISVAFLQFKTDRSDLINPSADFHQRWMKYTQSFGEANDLVVVVEGKSPERIKQSLDELAALLHQEPEFFSNILYKVEPGELRSKGLQYLAPAQLAVGLERLDEYRPILAGNWDLVRLETVALILKTQLESATTKEQIQGLLHHVDRLVSSLAHGVEKDGEFTNPWPDLLTLDPQMKAQGNQTVYLINDAGTMGFLKTSPVQKDAGSFEGHTRSIDRLRELMSDVTSNLPEVQMSLTGIPVLENDEMRRSQADMGWASMISEAGVLILMLICFRGVRHPIIGMIMLAAGTAWTFAFTTLTIGHLNILSISFVTILIGLGVDFGIHFLARYIQHRQQGMEIRSALVNTSGRVGVSILTGAITSALAFFCAAFTDFLGVAELGLIAGAGILLCVVATFTLLPAMLVISDRHRSAAQLPTPFQGELLRKAILHAPGTVASFSAVVILLLVVQVVGWKDGQLTSLVTYDHNLLNLQARGLESVETQNRIFASSDHSLLFAISLADSPAQVRELKAKFEALPEVRKVEEIATRLPDHSADETRLLVQGFHAHLKHLPEKLPPPKTSNPGRVGHALDDLFAHLKSRSEAKSLALSQKLDQTLNQLAEKELPEQMQILSEFQYRMSYALLAQFQALRAAANPAPVSLNDLPVELTSRFVAQPKSGKDQWLLQVYPAQQIWDMEPLTQFVTAVRKVDPNITGTPLQNFEAALQIKHSYEIAAMYALAVIVLVLLIDFLPGKLIWRCLIPGMLAALGVGVLAIGCQSVPELSAKLPLWSQRWLFENTPLMMVGTASIVTMLAAMWRSPGSVGLTLLALMPPVVSLAMTFGILVLINMPLNPANLIVLPLIIGLGVDSGVHLLHDFRHRAPGPYTVTPSLVNAIVLTVTTTMVGFGAMMIAAHRGLFSLGAVLTIGVTCCLFISLVPLPAILALLARLSPSILHDAEPEMTIDIDDADFGTHPVPALADETSSDDDEPRIFKHPAHVA